jgi:hypothetical protein
MRRSRSKEESRFVVSVGGVRPRPEVEPLFELVMIRYRVWLDALACEGRLGDRGSAAAVARVRIETSRRAAVGAVLVVHAATLAEAHDIARTCPLLLLPGGFADVGAWAEAVSRAG